MNDDGAEMGRLVAAAAQAWRDAAERAEVERAHLMSLAQEAVGGGASEYAVAEWAGVQRSTVPGWLGKR